MQTNTAYVGVEECDCSSGSGKTRKSCTTTYSCYLKIGTVDYGHGEIGEGVTFYDYEDSLGGKVR